MPTTEATITPFEAAKKLRLQTRAVTPIPDSVDQTLYNLKVNIRAMTEKKGAKEMKEYLPSINLQVQNIQTHNQTLRRSILAIASLVEHLPTAQGLPKPGHESALRAIQAVLNAHGYKFQAPPLPEDGDL